MKIHGSDGAAGIQRLLQKIEQVEGAPQNRQLASRANAPNVEKVEISPEAREIQHLKSVLDEIPDVRQKKVEEVRQLIEKGHYNIDLNAVSDRILKAILIGDI